MNKCSPGLHLGFLPLAAPLASESFVLGHHKPTRFLYPDEGISYEQLTAEEKWRHAVGASPYGDASMVPAP